MPEPPGSQPMCEFYLAGAAAAVPPGVAGRAASLVGLPEAQRTAALTRFTLLKPHLEDGVPLVRVAAAAGVPLRTAQRWLARYRADGLAGLARQSRRDQGRRRLPEELRLLIEGLALRRPAPSIAAVHRLVAEVARAHGWPAPSYSRIYAIVRSLDPALVTLAHEGTKRYREVFDLVHRREAARSNDIWQADHTELDLWVLAPSGPPARPWLTVIEDDYSRAVCGYAVSLEAPSALHTALALRQAIWRKPDPAWQVCGIPAVFYTDHGADFTSQHLEQVAADLKIRLVFSTAGQPRGRGKIERLFDTINQMCLAALPGYAPRGTPDRAGRARLGLSALDAAIGRFLTADYHQRPHGETGQPPQQRWAAGGFLPHLPETLEQLDLLLLTVAKPRKVHPDGIHLQGFRYLDPTLAAYVGEPVTIRYDPRDLAEIRVFHHEAFLTRAICPELAGQTVSLKDITAARNARRRELTEGIRTRAASSTGSSPSTSLTTSPNCQPSRPTPTANPPTRPGPASSATGRTDRRAGRRPSRHQLRRHQAAPAVRRVLRCGPAPRYIGVCHGPPGVGKTLSARRYAHWDTVETHLAGFKLYNAEQTTPPGAVEARTIVYTPKVHNTPNIVDKAFRYLHDRLSLAVETAQHPDHGPTKLVGNCGPFAELLIIDEADRLKTASLEQVRDHHDRTGIGVVLIGMPGIERRLARYPQLYSRIGFAHEYRPLSSDEVTFVITRHWQALGLTISPDDFTDAEAIAAVARITGGNFRLLQRLTAQIGRILEINQLNTVTSEVVATAREALIIGS